MNTGQHANLNTDSHPSSGLKQGPWHCEATALATTPSLYKAYILITSIMAEQGRILLNLLTLNSWNQEQA